RRLFREYPIIGELIEEPAFLHFDGRRLSLPDASVDRIACYDALHHVPNLEEVIAEMGRVLKVGGIAGFSEPGPYHSRSPQSQSEMRNYGVLENDINPLDIFRIAQQHGFTRISICAPAMLEINLNEYETMIDGHSDDRLHQRLTAQVRQVLMGHSIFFLHKGTLSLDSRSPAGLSHSISSPARLPLQSQRGQSVSIPLRIRNTGNATWLTQNIRGIGVVHVGLHLLV
ncbi:MAG: class I SAM-dependent methyltransferase, partial [Candidatus Roseilinea sp.]|uniref:class I SAM-dependent methyltransferase n=1 Tax=Candidatus Roseilinea sp. TaxID=2838777 RepID=UPI00404A7DB4